MAVHAQCCATESRTLESPVASTTGEAILTPNFVFATLASLVNSLGVQMLMATMPVYVLALGGTTADAGIVNGVPAVTALLLRPAVGWLTDAWRRRPMVLLGTASFGFASIVYLLVNSIPMLLLGRVVNGLGISSYTTAANAYIADLAPPRRRAEAVGIFSAAGAIGLIIGPAIGFLIIGQFDFQRLFYFSAALGFGAFAVSLLTREQSHRGAVSRHRWSPGTGIVAVDALPVAWTVFCLGIGFGTISAFISIFLQERGVGNPGLYFMVQAIALLFSRTFSGRVADRRGRDFVIVPGAILLALALAMLPLLQDLPHFMIAAALCGLGFGMAQPATMALLVDRVRQDQRGLATSTYFTGYDLGIALGSVVLGAVSQAWGFGVMWPIAGACTLCGLLGLPAARRWPSSAGGSKL